MRETERQKERGRERERERERERKVRIEGKDIETMKNKVKLMSSVKSTN